MPDLDQLSLNLATFAEEWDLARAVEVAARNGIRHAGLTRRQLAAEGAREAARILRNGGIEPTSLEGLTGFVAEEGSLRRRLLDEQRRAIEDAARIGAPCLTVKGGQLPPGSKDLTGARHMVEDGLTAVLDEAIGAGVMLAIEPVHPMLAERGIVCTTAQALDIGDGLGGDGIGIVLDLHACWWDPELERQVERAGRRLALVQFADWLSPTRSLVEDRGLMGDGVIDLPFWRRLVREHGYGKPFEVEIVSRYWRERDPVAFLHAIMERFESAC